MLENSKKFSIFNLYKHGVSINTINMLVNNNISIEEIYVQGESYLYSIMNIGKKSKTVIEGVNSIINSDDNSRCAIELVLYGISKHICDRFVSANCTIDDLKMLTSCQMEKQFNIKESMFNKVQVAINKCENSVVSSNENFDYSSIILLDTIDKLYVNEPLSTIKLKRILEDHPIYNIENLTDDLSKIRDEKKIEFTPNGIVIRKTRLIEAIEKISPENRKQMFTERLQGLTLEEIGNIHGITRERVRQIIAKIISKLESVEEDKYKNIICTYDINVDEFKTIFNEEETVYYYLCLKYSKGKRSTDLLLNDEVLNETQIGKLRESLSMVRFNDEFKVATKSNFTEFVIKKYAVNSIRHVDLLKHYNYEAQNNYKELNFEEYDERVFESRIERYDYVIQCGNHELRYYDFESLSSSVIHDIYCALDISDGFYSTEYIFNNNTLLMETANIQSENELHYILKHYFYKLKEKIEFIRMPNFIIGVDRDDFILQLINEHAPIYINDFTKMLYEDYGHKEQTMNAYLLKEFDHLLFNNEFIIEHKEVNDDLIKSLQIEMKHDIYLISEIKEIMRNLNMNFPNNFITHYTMSKIGYDLKSGYVISKKYKSITDYFHYSINNKNIIDFRDYRIRNLQAIYSNIQRFEKSFDIFRINSIKYVTIKKLNELGINKVYLHEVVQNIKTQFCDIDYFTLDDVYTKVDMQLIDACGMNDLFMESLISTIEEVKVIRISNAKIYSIQNVTLKKSEFIENILYKLNSVYIDVLADFLNDKYGIQITIEKIKEIIKDTDLFYKDTIGKIYVNKQDYYEEIYDE